MAAYLQLGDYFALFGYFSVVIGIGIWVQNSINLRSAHIKTRVTSSNLIFLYLFCSPESHDLRSIYKFGL